MVGVMVVSTLGSSRACDGEERRERKGEEKEATEIGG